MNILEWKLRKTKTITEWKTTNNAYCVSQREGEQAEIYWGWHDINIRAELESPVYFDLDRARGFCEGHHARHQQFLESRATYASKA